MSNGTFGTNSNTFSSLIKKRNGGGSGKAKKKKNENAQENNNKKDNTNVEINNEINEKINNDDSKHINSAENNLSDLKKLLFKNVFEITSKDNSNLDIEQSNEDDEDTNDIYGKSKYLNSQWTVWVHRNDCEDWTVNSYQNIHFIENISTFWEFFNNFQKINKEENQYFIMRNKIKPIWEDNNNRSGGICSLKIDCYDKNGKRDVGSEILICLCMLIMNESMMQDNYEINGISYAIKNRSIYIKIWTKDYGNNIVDKLPNNLLKKINSVVRNEMYKKFENYISIRYKPIKPEYEEKTE